MSSKELPPKSISADSRFPGTVHPTLASLSVSLSPRSRPRQVLTPKLMSRLSGGRRESCSVCMVRKMIAQDGNLQRWHQNSTGKNCRAFCFVFMVRKMMIQDGNLQRWPQNVCMCMCMRINLSGQMRATRVLPQPSGTTAQDAHVVSAAQGHRN